MRKNLIPEGKLYDNLSITKLTPLDNILKHGEECDKCGHCCKHDSGIVLQEEITRIADFMGMPRDDFEKEFLVEHEKFNTKCFKIKQIKENNKAYGKCIFYKDEVGCIIHDEKPLHCKVGSTKSEHGEQLLTWFTLNYFVNPEDPESIRQWASYLKSHPTIPGGQLHELIPDEERLKKILNYEEMK